MASLSPNSQGRQFLFLFFPTLQGLNDTEEQYRTLQEKIGSLGGGGLGDINKKVMQIKKEAEGLLNKATKGIEQLRSE